MTQPTPDQLLKEHNDSKAIVDEAKVQQARIQAHLAALRKQAFRIEVEVLPGGQLPTKAHPTDAGFDVYATEDISLYPGHILKHPLNFKMKLPAGTWARIETKSGLGSKGHLVYAGVIDEGYRGVPHAVMTNLNHRNPLEPIVVKAGQKVAQITMHPHSNEFYMEQVEAIDQNTSRGTGGFGSTGN